MSFLHTILWKLSWFPRHIARLAVAVGIVPVDAPRFTPIAFHAALFLFAVSLGLTLILLFIAPIAFLYGMPLVVFLVAWACYVALVFLLFRIVLEVTLFIVKMRMTEDERCGYREMLEENDARGE